MENIFSEPTNLSLKLVLFFLVYQLHLGSKAGLLMSKITSETNRTILFLFTLTLHPLTP